MKSTSKLTSDPLDIALKNVAETQRLLETLIISSESFDYPKAKLVLKELQRKSRELAKLQASLAAQKTNVPANLCTIDFQSGARAAQ